MINLNVHVYKVHVKLVARLKYQYIISLYILTSASQREISSLSCKRLKEIKKQRIIMLREALTNNKTITSTTKCYINLPEEEAHHAFHDTHGAASYAQRIHPKLVEKIHELVVEGITEVQEIEGPEALCTTHLMS